MNIDERIDQLADRFEAEWMRGNPPSIAQFLNACADPERLSVLDELIRIDAAYRGRGGIHPTIDDYLDRYPELKQQTQRVIELASYLSSLSADDPSSTSMNEGCQTVTEDAVQSLPANQMFGRFRLTHELGSGAFGSVYRAYDTRLQRHVAIKLLRVVPKASWESRQRFLRESQNVAQLRHESIAAVFEAGEQDGVPYLVSELIEGTTLSERIGEKKMPWDAATRLMVRLARAMDYAHQNKIVHRDLKPSNVLLDKLDRPFVTDFGLAKRMGNDPGMTVEGQLLGTPVYMSPEQASGRVAQIDQRTDIYSLGVLFYELLTGERPFRGELRMLLLQVQNEEPRPPRRLDDRIPRDLETICLKAMAKAPPARYQTAGEMADELERFLANKPILSRPVSAGTKVLRWSQRNWKRLLPAAVSAISLLAIGIAVAVGEIHAANKSASHAREMEQYRRRELLMERLQRMLAVERISGWRQNALELIRQAAELRSERDLRDSAAATLTGLDARLIRHLKNVSASSVALDDQGRQLLLGGYLDQVGNMAGNRARMCTLEKPDATPDDRIESVGLAAPGPVFFGPDGAATQLAITSPDRLVLYDLQTETPNQTLVIPDFAERPRDEKTSTFFPLPIVTVTPDGSHVAAASRLSEDSGIVVVWSTDTVTLLRRWDLAASAVALTPDGQWLAAGDEQGRVTIWSIEDGQKVAELQGGRNKINALQFHSSLGRRKTANGPPTSDEAWILAVGDAGGTVFIWDAVDARLVSICRGGHHRITTVAFSPDGTLVAAGAHAEVRIWDVATGRHVLRIDPQQFSPSIVLQWVSGLSFSADGKRLAISSLRLFSPPVVVVLALDQGRGVRTLRGLSTEVSKLRFSPDDQLIGAISHGWELGVWRVADGHLLRVLDAPVGTSSDNAGLVFSPDGRWVAACSDREARLWDITSGIQICRWELPAGLQNELAFAEDGRLCLLRFETRGGQMPPRQAAIPTNHPQVCRTRHLRLDGSAELVGEYDDFDRHVDRLLLSPRAEYFVGLGEFTGPDGSGRRLLRAFDWNSSKVLWTDEMGGYLPSRGGPLVTIRADDGRDALFELPSGRFLLRAPAHPTMIGTDRRLVIGPAMHEGRQPVSGFGVYRPSDNRPVLVLGMDQPVFTAVELSLDETRVSWGNTEGTVQLADLPTIQNELASFGLDW